MKYSKRLGHITNKQFQQALDAFDLGGFRKAETITLGLGQNVFLTTNKGEYVFRGHPHYPWQFKNEKFFADRLYEETQVLVPHPYLLNEDTSIFGWEYVIMPKMKGKCLSDNLDEDFLSDDDRMVIAKVQGQTLREAQKLTNDFSGKYDLKSRSIKPYKPDYLTVYRGKILKRLSKTTQYNAKTPQSDIAWARKVLDDSKEVMSRKFKPTFVMQDYKPGHMMVDKLGKQWRITGLFDLMEASFGNGEADISRMFCVYIEKGREELAYAFVNSYLQGHKDIAGFIERFPVFILHDRSLIWEWVQRTNKVWWDKSLTFKQWVEPFICL